MKRFLIFLALLFVAGQCLGQVVQSDSLQYAKLILTNGNKVSGQILKLTDSLIVLSTDIGEVSIQRADTKELQISNKPWDSEKDISRYVDMLKVERWYSDWNNLLPTARPTGEGRINYRNDYIFLQRFSIGLSEQFSLDAGFEILSMFALRSPVVYVQPKYSIALGQSYLSIGATTFVITDEEFAVGTLPFLNYTLGTAANNYTVGIGVPLAFGAGDAIGGPLVFNLATNQRISSHLSFSGEVVIADGGVVGQLGLNVRTNGNVLLRFGVLRPFGEDIEGLGVPLVGVSLPIK